MSSQRTTKAVFAPLWFPKDYVPRALGEQARLYGYYDYQRRHVT